MSTYIQFTEEENKSSRLPHLKGAEMIAGTYTFSSAERLKIVPDPYIKKSLSDIFPGMASTLKSIFSDNALYASLPTFIVWKLDLLMHVKRMIKATEDSRKLKADFKIKNSQSPQQYFHSFLDNIENILTQVASYHEKPTSENKAGVNKCSDWLLAMPELLQAGFSPSLASLLPPIRERAQLGVVIVDNIKIFQHILFLNSGANYKLYPELAIGFKHTPEQIFSCFLNYFDFHTQLQYNQTSLKKKFEELSANFKALSLKF